jgi:hypothetical protein
MRSEVLGQEEGDDVDGERNTKDWCSVMDPFPETYGDELLLDAKYHGGNAKIRCERVAVRDVEFCCAANGVDEDEELSIETGVFPYLFPDGEGSCSGVAHGLRMCEYLQMRVWQLFSPFTYD